MQHHAMTELGLSRRLRLSQLFIFDRVVETGSIMRTANDLSMTQPAVTKIIQELESSFDGALFARSNRGVVPTELGRLLSRRVKSLLGELRYMTEELNEFPPRDRRASHRRHAHLRFGIPAARLHHLAQAQGTAGRRHGARGSDDHALPCLGHR
jgi:DNA-binding transcriptional LysR family regulator